MNSTNKRNIKVRFHLGAGKNYKHWRIQRGSMVFFINPDGIKIRLKNCKLINQKKSAQKIFNSGDKTVCAWIMCESITNINKIEFDTPLKYNPRIQPNWLNGETILDNNIIDEICIEGNKLFIKNN